MVQHEASSISAFESYVLSCQSPKALEFYLKNTISIHEPYIEYRECVVYHKGDLYTFLNALHHVSVYSMECVNQDIPAFRITRWVADNQPIQGVFAILKGTNNFLYRIVTVSKSYFWNLAVKPFIKRMYPEIGLIYFRQDELERALLNFEKQLMERFYGKARLNVIEVTKKSERPLRLSQKTKHIDTERSWTHSSLGETFSELKERGFWFTSLKYQIERASRGQDLKSATGKIYKFGTFSCTNMYDELRSFLIEPLELIAIERMHLLDGRGIVERDYKPGPPLEILYDEDVFVTTDVIRKFGEILNHYIDASIVTYHGNPYFHANIADQKDGSSFEIWVLSQRRILISPQAKSSVQALSRVISFIFDRFKEGVVSEYAPG